MPLHLRDSLPRVFCIFGIQILFRQYASHFGAKAPQRTCLQPKFAFCGAEALLGWPAGPLFYCAEHGSYLVWLFLVIPFYDPADFRGAPTRKAGERSCLAAVSHTFEIFQMDETALERKVIDLAAPIVQSLGLFVWGLEIVSGPRTIVRLFVESPLADAAETGIEGVPVAGIDELEQISRRLELALDVEDCFPHAWTLEVSTPGFSRRFFEAGQLASHIGDIIEARLLAPLENYPGNPSVIRGKLAGLEDSILNIEPCAITGDGEIIPENLPPASFPFEAARRISRIHIFKKPQKPGGKKNVPAGKKA